MHALIETHAARRPDALALVFEDEEITYGELNRRANQLLAHNLRRRGVGPETLVALCVDRSPTLIVALLAILKAGGAYVPLDPAYPASRLQFMLADSAAPFIVTEEHLLDSLPPTRRPSSASTATRRRSRASRQRTPRAGSVPRTSPTSCTRRGRPESRKGS